MSPANVVFVCTIGCCKGCQDCYGMQIGCHQRPCRCDRPCDCKYDVENDAYVSASGACERHSAPGQS